MNRMQRGIVAGLWLLPGSGLAQQLPPQAERAAELSKIIASDAVTRGLKDEAIIRIESLTSRAYRIASDNCTVMVKIVDDMTPTPRVGPRQFDVMVTGVTCG